jgi:hypothetical protein
MNHSRFFAAGAFALLLVGCTSAHDRPEDRGTRLGEGTGCVRFGDTTRFSVTVPAVDPGSCLSFTVALVDGEPRSAVAGDVEVTRGYALESGSRLDLDCERIHEGEIATSGAAVTRADGTVTVSQVRGDCWDLEAALDFEFDDGGRESVSVQLHDMTTCLP